MRYQRSVPLLLLAMAAAGAGVLWFAGRYHPAVDLFMARGSNSQIPTSAPILPIAHPGKSDSVQLPLQVYQTFNNCGPATLSMILAWSGVRVSQAELSRQMRPYQNPQGNNDDKTVFPAEFVYWAKSYGVYAVTRPDGTIQLLKTLLANGIPVVVKTTLHANDDIGHFRIITGYDDTAGVVIQSDSFQGPHLRYTYKELNAIWQPFNYQYIIVVPQTKAALVGVILGLAEDEPTAWKDAAARARKELAADPASVYAQFNLSTALFHMGDYRGSVAAYEAVASRLPRRTLWYQIEPIRAYLNLKEYGKVFVITDAILNGGNRAFSELYHLRGQAYQAEGKTAEAQAEFAKAEQYHAGFNPAIPGL